MANSPSLRHSSIHPSSYLSSSIQNQAARQTPSTQLLDFSGSPSSLLCATQRSAVSDKSHQQLNACRMNRTSARNSGIARTKWIVRTMTFDAKFSSGTNTSNTLTIRYTCLLTHTQANTRVQINGRRHARIYTYQHIDFSMSTITCKSNNCPKQPQPTE